MAEVERIYNVPLGHVKDIPRTKRAPYAMKQIRDFVVRHMKVDEEDEVGRQECRFAFHGSS